MPPIIVPAPPLTSGGEVYDLAVLVTGRLFGLDEFTVYRGSVPATPPGAYVVLYFGAGSAFSTRLAGGARELRITFRAVCAGYSDEQVLNTVDLVRGRLTDWRPVPDDRAVGVVNEVQTDPPLLRDDSVPGDIRFSSTLLYRLNTPRSP